MLDWIFEGIVGWVAGVTAKLMDAVSGLFLEALGTDMTAMEEYFPFVIKAYGVMQVMAYAILILIVIWQVFRAFGGPITEAENPWHLVVRGAIFGFLIGYAKPIFSLCLDIARAPYTSLMDISMSGEDFTFAGVEQALSSGLTTIVAAASIVGLILILVLLIALGWNYFKLLLETVERYIVVGVLCYTSPLAFSLGASKNTSNVFKSWCRMVGSQLLLLVMNVWFLRGFASSMGQFMGNGGALTNGKGSIFLWMFCTLAYLKCAQRFDSYLSSIGLNVAQTGSSMGMELLMAARVMTGTGGAARSAGSVFNRGGGTPTGTGAAATGFAAGFASRFSPNSYVRDAVVDGGARMGFGGGAGFVARVFGGMAARNGATLNSQSVSSVASRAPGSSGTIAGDIADRSLGNYLPHMRGFQLQGTQITGGHISTTATTADGKQANVDLYSASQYEKPDVPYSVVTAQDGSQWYQVASGEGRGAFYDAPTFGGMNAQSDEGGVNAEPGAGTGSSGAQPDAAGAPAGENIVPGADGAIHTDLSQDVPDAPGGAQSGVIAAGGAETSAYETVIPGPGVEPRPDVQRTGEVPQGGVIGGDESGSIVDQLHGADAAAIEGAEMPQTDSGIVPELTQDIPEGEALQGVIASGLGDPVPGGDELVDPPDLVPVADAGAEFPQTDSGFASDIAAQQLASDAGAVIGDVPDGPPEVDDVPVSDSHIIAFPGGNGEIHGSEDAIPFPEGGPHEAPVFAGGGADADGSGVLSAGGAEAPRFDAGVSGGTHDTGYGPDMDDTSGYSGGCAEAPLVAATFPDAQDGTMLRTVGEGMIEASSPDGGNTLWYNSAFYQEPDAPHSVMEAANGVQWYAMQQQAQAPEFESGVDAAQYNQALFRDFMPGYEGQVAQVDGSHRQDGHFEVRNEDGSGTVFYDTARFAAPRGDYQVMEDARGSQWYAIRGEAAVDRKPVYENGQAVNDDGKLRTVSVETVRYRQTPARFADPQKRADIDRKPPRRKL